MRKGNLIRFLGLAAMSKINTELGQKLQRTASHVFSTFWYCKIIKREHLIAYSN
jgi:hypothetical protein